MFSSFKARKKTILFLSKNHLLEVEKINESVNHKMMILKRREKVDNVTKNSFAIYNQNLH